MTVKRCKKCVVAEGRVSENIPCAIHADCDMCFHGMCPLFWLQCEKTERDLMFEDALFIPEIHATKTCVLCS